MPGAIKKQAILPRIDGIQGDVQKLQRLSTISLAEFGMEDNFIKAQFYLRRALEGVFHIGTHLLSRIPGGRVTEYKAIAIKLGELGIIPRNFAENELKAMAGYRNWLTHFYADVTSAELYEVIRTHLSDFNTFLNAVKEVLSNPEKFNITIEE